MVDNKETKPVRCGCGGEPEIWHNFGGLAFISCKSCEITTKGYDNHFQAIEAWNKAMGAKDINVPNTKGYWMATYDGMHCSICNYKCETTALPQVCPRCGINMKTADEWYL